MADEETLQKRLLYREKPTVRNVAVKTLELITTFSQATYKSICEELEVLEVYTKRMSVVHSSALVDTDYYQQLADQLAEKNAELRKALDAKGHMLERERTKRRDLIDYEDLAKAINKLPPVPELEKQLEDIDKEAELLKKDIDSKHQLLKRVKQNSGLLVYSLQQLQQITAPPK